MSIGEKLRIAREEMGATLGDVENETKIRSKYIKALENDEFDILPGKVYIRGFLRNYARFLGLDGEALVAQYDELFPSQTDPVDTKSEKSAAPIKKPFKWSKGLTIAVSLLAIVWILAYLGGAYSLNQPEGISGNNDMSQNKKDSVVDRQGAANNQQSGSKDPGSSDLAANSRGINMVLQVTDKECWMWVVVDNRDVFQGVVGPGNIKEFAGEESIWLKLGNAGAVKVRANGKDYGYLGGPGQVVTKVFPEQNGSATAGG